LSPLEKTLKNPTNAALTRKKLISAALPLFLNHGYDGTGINQILKQAKLSKGAFYHHFSSKEQIYQEIMAEFFLKPIKQLDLEELENFPLKIMRKVISDHYENLPKTIAKNANINLTRYYAAFYEALCRLPNFKSEINSHYASLIKILADKTNKEREIFPKVAQAHAKNIISTLEGKMLLDVLVKD